MARVPDVQGLEKFRALMESDPQAARKLLESVTSKKFIPHPAQQEVMDSTARFRTMCAGRRAGKCLSLDTLLPTPDGFRRADSIRVGDELFGQDGQPTKVTGVFRHSDQRMYRMTFSDRAQIEVCEDHLWEVRDRRDRPSRVLDTATIAGSYIKPMPDGKRYNRWKLVWGQPVAYPKADLLIDPYLVGVLLGDGSITRGCAFASADEEIIERVRSIVEEDFGGHVKRYSQYEYGITKLRPALRELGMHGHGFATKFVPPQYMTASIEQRLELLRGLMDTDGHIATGRGGAGCGGVFQSGSEQLAKDVQELVRSLGGKASINKRITASGNPGWCVYAYMTLNPFWLKRKADRFKPKRTATRAIINVERIPDADGVCFEVDSPAALYYAGREYILTHNTKIASALALRNARKHKQMVWWVAPTYRIVKRGYVELLRQLPHELLSQPPQPETTFDGGRPVVLRFKNGSRMEFYSAERPEGMLGEGVDFAVLDEAATMREDTWTQIVRPTLADRQGGALLISTPRGRNWFYRMWLRGQDPEQQDYASWRFPSMANPHIPANEWLEMEETLPRAVYEQEILAEFISNAAAVFRIPEDGVRPLHTPTGHVMLGLDLAKHHDFSVLYGVNTHDRMPCYHERFNAVSWPEQRARIQRAVEKIERTAESVTVMMDSTGIGDVVYDDLSYEGLDAVPIKFTAQWKQQAVMRLAADLERGEAFIHDAQRREFESYAYEITDNGRWKFSAPRGSYDDEVSAALLAHWGIITEGVPDVRMLTTGPSQVAQPDDDPWVDTEPSTEPVRTREVTLHVPTIHDLLVHGWS
jgi:hypothetical protein